MPNLVSLNLSRITITIANYKNMYIYLKFVTKTCARFTENMQLKVAVKSMQLKVIKIFPVTIESKSSQK